MKKIIVSIMPLIIAANCFCQQTHFTQNLSREDYIKKSKHQKTAAWIMLGGGAALAVTDLAIGIHSVYDEFGTVFTSGHDDRSFVAGEIVFYTGLASMVGSIPLFVASARNKRKSMAISTYFKIERYVAIQNNGFSNQLYPAISLHMNL